MTFSELMEERLNFYINLYEQTLKEVEEADEPAEVKKFVKAIYTAKVEALTELKKEFY